MTVLIYHAVSKTKSSKVKNILLVVLVTSTSLLLYQMHRSVSPAWTLKRIQYGSDSWGSAYPSSAFDKHNTSSRELVGQGYVKNMEMYEGTLKPHKEAVIPRIAHFTWIGCREFEFYNLISILSVYRIMKPDRIIFHADCEPKNKMFLEARKIPILEIDLRDTPNKVFGIPLANNWHRSDVLRLQVLRETGGVYFDLDMWVVKSLDPLLHYDFVVGKPGRGRLCNCIIFASKNSKMLDKFYNNYRNYDPNGCFACAGVHELDRLGFENKDLLHIEMNTLRSDNVTEQYNSTMDWEHPRYTIHFFFREKLRKGQPLVNSENIKTMDNMVGEIARYIYYGEKNPIVGNRTAVPWYNQSQDLDR